MEHGQEHITVVDENGNEQLFEVLFTFDSEDFGKSYVLYFPVGAEEDVRRGGLRTSYGWGGMHFLSPARLLRCHVRLHVAQCSTDSEPRTRRENGCPS